MLLHFKEVAAHASCVEFTGSRACIIGVVGATALSRLCGEGTSLCFSSFRVRGGACCQELAAAYVLIINISVKCDYADVQDDANPSPTARSSVYGLVSHCFWSSAEQTLHSHYDTKHRDTTHLQ